MKKEHFMFVGFCLLIVLASSILMENLLLLMPHRSDIEGSWIKVLCISFLICLFISMAYSAAKIAVIRTLRNHITYGISQGLKDKEEEILNNCRTKIHKYMDEKGL